MHDSDDLNWLTDDVDEPADRQSVWRILIVDDEPDVHESTLLAVGRESILGRRLQFLHAYDSESALALLKAETDIAVILLDVVMEEDQAGLELVRRLREDLNLNDVRIILRTGQPGYAPEAEAVSRYEINDYKAKSELTRNKLFTSLTTAIRSYAQIRSLAVSKIGLERIIRASRELIYLRGSQEFANGLLTQLALLLETDPEGLVCARKAEALAPEQKADDFRVLTATGRFSHWVDRALGDLEDQALTTLMRRACKDRESLFDGDFTCLYFNTPEYGEMLVYLTSGTPLPEEMQPLLELFATNVAACMDNVTLLEQQHTYAYYDAMTGLPNRLSFLLRVDDVLRSEETGYVACLLDIDNFSQLNDTIGSYQGDQLLQAVANRLKAQSGAEMVARIAGDSFALLGRDNQLRPEQVKSLFTLPFGMADGNHTISVTQGRTTLGRQAAANEVLAQMSMALNAAKRSLRGACVDYVADMLKETENRVQLLQNLRQSFSEERLFMVYQPKIDLKTGEVVGVEALMRWRTDSGEFVPPIEFIPVAESSGMIVALGEWALRSALVQVAGVAAEVGCTLPVAVNVSVVQFEQPGFIEVLRGALGFAGVEPSLLELEITESVAMRDLSLVKDILDKLNAMGVRVSIDDFGTGFSSLSYLEQLAIHTLKIDKSFIDRLDAEGSDCRIPETILRLGQAMGLEVVAEGVETQTQLDWLRTRNCDVVQGYLFSRPLTHSELKHWLRQQKVRSPLPGQTGAS